jgi:hypothetical protein
VYDRDKALVGADDRDFISRAVLDMTKIEHSKKDEVPRPTWHNLYYSTGGPVSG